jgi:hypothetical protein
MQINLPIWEDEIKAKFGYTRADLFDARKNVTVAHWIYDRGDGKEGDGEGNYNAWVARGTDCFLEEL